MRQCKLYLNHAGYCLARADFAMRGEKKRLIPFAALFALIQHPHMGYILFDTGYSTRFYEATRFFPNKLYAWATKVTVQPENEVKQQLAAKGIAASEIKHIIISHFHADHIAGLKDFNHATIYCSRMAYHQAKKINRLVAFSKGILKALIPGNIEDRLRFVEEGDFKKEHDQLGAEYDLFGDDSILAYPLPGHAAGQIGIRLQTEKGKYFLVADACWNKRAYLHHSLPHPLVRLFFHSWGDYKKSIEKLKRFHLMHPDVIIVPTHCAASTEPLIHPQINFDAL
jgi:glyoxylase-like metal-dependent hydrolase (beta-lactamase superfamily II)